MIKTRDFLERVILLNSRGLRDTSVQELKKLFLESLIYSICDRIYSLKNKKHFFERNQMLVVSNSFSFSLLPRRLQPSYSNLENTISVLNKLIDKLYIIIYVIERALHQLIHASPKETSVNVQSIDYASLEKHFNIHFEDSKGVLKTSTQLLTSNKAVKLKVISWIDQSFEENDESYTETVNKVYKNTPILMRKTNTTIIVLSSVFIAGSFVIRKFCLNYNFLKSSLLNGKTWLYSHLVAPIGSILLEVFLQETPQIVDPSAVQDATVSFQKMTQNLTKIFGKTTNSEPLTTLSRSYEEQLSSPLKNLIFGDLLQLILIQVQFLKLQGLKGMSQIDKILKENQFNTQILTLLPGLLAVYISYYGIKYLFQLFSTQNQIITSTKRDFRKVLLSIGVELSLLNRSENELKINEGKISYLVLELCENISKQSIFKTNYEINILQNLLLRNGLSRLQQQSIFNAFSSNKK